MVLPAGGFGPGAGWRPDRRAAGPPAAAGGRAPAARCPRRQASALPLGHGPSGHALALVVQGHRHPAPCRLCRRDAHRARHPLEAGLSARPAGRQQGPGLSRGKARPAGRLPARPDDRELVHHRTGSGPALCAPCPCPPGHRAAGRRCRRRPARSQHPAGPGAVGRRDRLPGPRLRRAGTRPHRCRADDVRAGQLRALPPQDLQRRLHHRRPAAGTVALRHDPRDPQGPPAGHGGGLFRQRRHPGRRHAGRLERGPGHWPLPLVRRAGASPAEGRDPQPPHGHRPPPGRSHRQWRRDP